MENDLWVISDGRLIKRDLSNICKEVASGEFMEYKISELAYYLLSPNPVKVKDRLVGCRIKRHKPSAGIIRDIINKVRPGKANNKNRKGSDIEEIISSSKIESPTFKDGYLNQQFMKIKEGLSRYDPVQKKLAALDREKIDDITGVCEEIEGNRYPLDLTGTIDDKIRFLSSLISRKTEVILNKAYRSRGLFEMRGFKFDSYNGDNSYRIIEFTLKGKTRYCVVKSDYKFEYWIDDDMLINYLLIFEQSIRTDPKLREALSQCARGEVTPLKLFFSKKLDKKYSESYLPLTYREIFTNFNIEPDEKAFITNIMNDNQAIIFFSYATRSAKEKQKTHTNISVMHDFKALEPIRDQLPHLYSEIDKKAYVSDAGKLYLMDSMRESQNV